MLKKSLMLTLGWSLILLGLAGLVLPVLQGWLFLGLGLLVLSKESPWVRCRIERARERHPRLDRVLHRGSERMHALKERLRRRKDTDDRQQHGEARDEEGWGEVH